MADNLYGYNDYSGPTFLVDHESKNCDSSSTNQIEVYDDEEEDPLRVGMWLEGDSLAPPCGSSISVVHSLIDLAFESSQLPDEKNEKYEGEEVLYDLGCGDGRVCLEAYWRYMNADTNNGEQQNLPRKIQCVGVEIEDDLVVRFRELIRKLPPLPFEAERKDREGGDLSVPHSSNIHAVQGDLCEVLQSLVDRQKESGVVDDDNGNSCKEGEASLYVYLPLPTVITMYLLPEAITLIEPTLVKMMNLNPKLRIICHSWGMRKCIKPSKTVDAIDKETGLATSLFLYTADSFNIS